MIFIKKIEKEYKKKYSHISNNHMVRIMNLLDNTKSIKGNILEEVERIKNIKQKKVSFVIYLTPKATPRARENRRSKIFYVSGAKDNKDIFTNFLINSDLDMITTQTIFNCNIFIDIPNSMSNMEKILAEMGFIRPIVKPDWDNLGKTYSDMIQGQFLLDDSLIIDGRVQKFYSSKPRIEIDIIYAEEFDSIYNNKKIERRVIK